MCGIVGFTGKGEAVDVLLSGLKSLEYRGYDSAGVAVIAGSALRIRKTKGKISDLRGLIKKSPLSASSLGIAHTRWATHGAPTKPNAHPHTSCDKKIALVHNGIIENYLELKRELQKAGHTFSSQTDTEVLVHLIERHYKGCLEDAVIKALRRVRGSFAIGVVSGEEPEKIVAARRDSPLIVAENKGNLFLASDVPALLGQSRKVLYLGDDEVAVLKKGRVRLLDFKKRSRKPKFVTVALDAESAQKGGYAHFMLKEIFEQPLVLKKLFIHGLKEIKAFRFPKSIDHIAIVACGTAYHAGLVGKYIVESLTGIPVSVDLSSEFRYREPIVNKSTLVIAVSQSGETADTLAAVREARRRRARIISICNVVGSSLARESEKVFYTLAGPEIGVASTKAYTAQLAVFYMLGLELARQRKVLSAGRYKQFLKALQRISALQAQILKKHRQIKKVAQRHHHFGSFLFLGRHINYPSALEGALKLKEISYIPAEGYAAGEMKHGPIALIDEYRAVVCIAVKSRVYEKMISNIQEIKARSGKLVAIASQGDSQIGAHVREVIFVPPCGEFFSPLLVALPLQLFAYYVAVARGCPVDQPRNLAKSVTVE